MDLRNQTYGEATGTKAGALVPPMYWVLGQLLTTSCLLSLALFTRVELWFFTFANLTALVLLLFSALVVEFHQVVIDPDDAEILGHRPLTQRTYAAARLTNLGLWVALLTLSMTIFPAVVGAAMRDAGPFFLPLYLVAAVLCALTTTAVLVLLHTSLGAGPALERARGLLAWVQILAIMALFYGGQFMLRDADGGVELFAARPPAWVHWLPSAWLSDLSVQRLLFATPIALVLMAVAGLRLGVVWGRLNAGARASDRLAVGDALEGTTLVGWKRLLLRDRREAAIFWLVWTSLGRDTGLKLRVWSTLGTVAAALIIGALTGELGNPFEQPAVLSLALPVLFAAAVPPLFRSVHFGGDPAAGWLLQSAPTSPRLIDRAVRKALLARVLLPVALLCLVTLGWLWRAPLSALLQVSVCWAVVELSARLTQGQTPGALPFSRPIAAGGASGSTWGVAALTSAAAMGVAAAQYAFGPRLWLHAGLLVGLFALLVPVGRWSARGGARG
jgi:hypothetical protein